MTSRDILNLCLISVLFWFTFQWVGNFFFPQKSVSSPDIVSGQMYKAPTSEQILKPINTEIDFYDSKPAEYEEKTTSIETPQFSVVLDSLGASCKQIGIKRTINGTERIISLIDSISDMERENRAFVVGLQEKTPYYYDLIDQHQENTAHYVTYRAETDEVVITKTFIFNDETCKIDLQLTLEPKSHKSTQARIFLPAPLIAHLAPQDTIQGIFLDEQDRVKKMKPSQLEGSLWAAPQLFGSEDRYFITALTNDPQHFVQRGYYRLSGVKHIITILEGLVQREAQTWTLSFYCGPKQLELMKAVDDRLEQTLEYGWLAPLARGLLYLLKGIYKFTHNYGWSIIILTLLITLILLPFGLKKPKSASSSMEMFKKLKYVEQKYQHNPEQLAEERKKIYDKYGGMPNLSGSLGCLPLLLQMPIFFALNRVLSNAIELYQAPFIKGWINDLSVKDPYYILPTIVGAGMLTSLASSGDVRQRVVMVFISIIFGYLFSNLAAGLALYIVINVLMNFVRARLQK